ncbi:MAG: arginine--tRNA ligase, partial [Nanoarchaeota archaeon]
MMEFSQPNTHKAFHVGHIRGTILGESISRIFEFTGNKVIRANYSGDTGMHIAKWIWCYKNFHSKKLLTDDESWIAGIYVDAVKRLSDNEQLQEQVDEINRKLDSKEDKKLNELWSKTRKLSIKSWEKIYEELDTKFDKHYFESEVEESGKEISKDLVKKGIAVISDEAVIMDLEKYNLGIWVLLRKDGTVLYSAKDIALAKRKCNDYKLDKSIIITADEQNLHFQQLIKTLELMNFSKKNIFSHIGYAVVRLPHGKMSS